LTIREIAPDAAIAAVPANEDSINILELSGATHVYRSCTYRASIWQIESTADSAADARHQKVRRLAGGRITH